MDLVGHPDTKEYKTLMNYEKKQQQHPPPQKKTPSVTLAIIQVNHRNCILITHPELMKNWQSMKIGPMISHVVQTNKFTVQYMIHSVPVVFLFLDSPPPGPPPPETTETVTMETTTIVLADPQPQGQEEDKLPIYLGGIAAGAVLVIFILALVLCICIKQRQRQNLTDYGNFGKFST